MDVTFLFKRKRTRDVLKDIDYLHKLSVSERQWMDVYLAAVLNQDIDAMAALVDQDKIRLGRLQSQIYREANAERRDLTYVGSRVQIDFEEDSFDKFELTSTVFEFVRCARCLQSVTCVCAGNKRINKKAYTIADYIPEEYNEETAQAAIYLKRRMQAYDLLPYGDSPKDLKIGHAVKICLPAHLLKNAWGFVVDHRPIADEYLIRSMSRPGLRDQDGALPEVTLCWVKPTGLRRHPLKLLPKEYQKPDDSIKDLKNEGKRT